jgi:hypothetical protein
MDYKTKIDSLLNNYEKKTDAAKKKEEHDHQIFLQSKNEALRIEKEIIVPPMEKIGEHLKLRGHNYTIEEKIDDYKPSVTMKIFPKPYDVTQNFMPHIWFIFEIGENVIRIISDDSMVGKGKSFGHVEKQYKFDEITLEIVENEIIALLHKIF